MALCGRFSNLRAATDWNRALLACGKECMKRRRRNRTSTGAAGKEDAAPAKKRKVEKEVVESSELADDGLKRCDWASQSKGAVREEYLKYHDEEWGRPCYDDTKLFEFITLEGAQAGLSWATILRKREAYLKAFLNFDIESVAKLTDADVAKLLQPDSNIVKNKLKVKSTVDNARCCLEVQKEFGSLSKYLWSFVPNGKPIINKWKNLSEMPTKTPEAEAMSKDLKSRGFRFVGPTICYAFMQAVGMVNDHTIDCHCYEEVCRADALEAED